MIDIKPFKGTRPYKEQAENLIAPSTDHLSEEGIIDIHEKNYWNYLKILNPVGKTKEEDALKEANAALEIPQFGTKHSFNISISIGIILWDYHIKTNIK